MDSKLNQEKLKMWQAKLKQTQKEYEAMVLLRGQAAAMGDLRENAAFQDADEQSAVLSKRMSDIEKIITELENSDPPKKKGGS